MKMYALLVLFTVDAKIVLKERTAKQREAVSLSTKTHVKSDTKTIPAEASGNDAITQASPKMAWDKSRIPKNFIFYYHK